MNRNVTLEVAISGHQVFENKTILAATLDAMGLPKDTAPNDIIKQEDLLGLWLVSLVAVRGIIPLSAFLVWLMLNRDVVSRSSSAQSNNRVFLSFLDRRFISFSHTAATTVFDTVRLQECATPTRVFERISYDTCMVAMVEVARIYGEMNAAQQTQGSANQPTDSSCSAVCDNGGSAGAGNVDVGPGHNPTGTDGSRWW